jgi:hypothetical protein
VWRGRATSETGANYFHVSVLEEKRRFISLSLTLTLKLKEPIIALQTLKLQAIYDHQ